MKLSLIPLALLLTLTSISAQSQTTIWKLENFNQASGAGANVGRSVSVFGGTSGIAVASTTWITTTYLYVYASNWGGGMNTKGFKLTVDTRNFTGITLSYSHASDDYNGTNIGPRDFQLQYSLDDVTYTNVTNGTEVLTGGVSFGECVTKTNLPLPSQCDNKSAVYLRWIMTSNAGAKGQTITSAGQSKLADILIKGTELPVAPTDITLSNNTVAPNQPGGTTVGTFSVADFNATDTQTLTLVSGTGSTDNAKFQITGSTLKTAAPIAAGTYSIRVRTNDGTYTFEKIFSIVVDIIYPAISFTDQTWDYISNVTFNTINYTSAGASGGYENKTDLTTLVSRGSTYTLSVTNPPTATIDPAYPEYIKAWIDWNKNGAFEASEAYEVGSGVAEQKASTVPVTVPNDAVLGTTRMRVAILGTDQSLFPASSGALDYGEAEDYTIQVGAALPVELTAFTASTSAGKVTLKWTTATEVNNHGFEIERAAVADDAQAAIRWEKIGFVQGHGNSSAPRDYAFTDMPVGGTRFSYRLKQIDVDGAFHYSETIEGTMQAPTCFAVYQNYPNPFNPTTKIRYDLPNDGHVRITIFDALGREVKTLLDQHAASGHHEIDFDGNGLPNGMYLYRIQSGIFSETRKMMLVK